MKTLRLLCSTLALLVQGYSPASAETAKADPPKQINGDARLINAAEADHLLKRYKSIPGNGVVKGDAGIITRDEADHILKRYDSIPGGLIFEGAAELDWVKNVRYDSQQQTFVLNDSIFYALPLRAQSAAILATAIAADDRLGVSLGEETEIVYGQVPTNSNLALDLKLGDVFLADIVLPPQEWTIGYRYAGGFKPKEPADASLAAVFFRLEDFRFEVKDQKLMLQGANFRARIVPVTETRARDGGYLPDMEAIGDESALRDYETNAKHVAENIDYYLREEIVSLTTSYGEAAAFFRGLKNAGIDLPTLAGELRIADGTPSLPAQNAPALEDGWQEYLRGIQTRTNYENWSSPPYDTYMNWKKTTSDATSAASLSQASSK